MYIFIVLSLKTALFHTIFCKNKCYRFDAETKHFVGCGQFYHNPWNCFNRFITEIFIGY